MPFPRRLLNEGEEVSLDLRPHWWYFANHIFTGIPLLVIFFVIVAETSGDAQRVLLDVWGVITLIWAVWLVLQYLKWNFTHFVVTTDRVIYRTGVLSKHSVEIPLERVNNINFNQSIWERMIGAGDLEIESAGRDGQSKFDDVQHPPIVQQEIYKQMELVSRRRAQWLQPQASGAAPATVPTTKSEASIPEQLDQLASLRDRGVISDAEFEAKKAQLLERM
ncbi:MAG TPA: PH domain-containing protein [Acidimicrobiia bacterium]|nr:PH domain-containing protein [Acidimicrobiia bacterium]